MINLKGKKILITGATGGIGGALVKKFDSLNGTILATGTNIEKLDLQKDSNNMGKEIKALLGHMNREKETKSE